MILLFAAAAPARAETNVAVLDVARVFEQYEMTRDLETIFDQKRQEAAEEAKKRTADIDSRRKSLAGFDPNSEAYATREAEVSKKETEYQVWSTETERGLKTSHKRWLLTIYHNTQAAVAEVAKERNVDLVVTYDKLTDDAPDSVTLRQQILLQKVIYSNERIDLTTEVLGRLNKAYQAGGGVQSIDAKSLNRADAAGGGGKAAPPAPAAQAAPMTAKPGTPPSKP